jgi:DNA-binding PadR family transcriptional regulator
MPTSRLPIPQGTLDMLILQILSLEPAHGYDTPRSGYTVSSPKPSASTRVR